jgi:hypothetical protein
LGIDKIILLKVKVEHYNPDDFKPCVISGCASICYHLDLVDIKLDPKEGLQKA